MSAKGKIVVTDPDVKVITPSQAAQRKRTTTIVVAIVVVVLLLVGLGLILWLLVFRKKQASTLGQHCGIGSKCAGGLVCDSNSGTCKEAAGGSCSVDATVCDPTTTRCISGVCEGIYNTDCAANSQCISPGQCKSGKCTSVGNACVIDSDCSMIGAPPLKCSNFTCTFA